jgi:glycosyltransferase involved in cell wall biosynthesis
MLTLGIFADTPKAATGMAVVNHNLARNLTRMFDDELRVIYFARFGLPKGARGIAEVSTVHDGYEVVNVEGGVWKEYVVNKCMKRYRLDAMYSEDDWWSMQGLLNASKRNKVPFYFMSPIDSLPIQEEGKRLLESVRKVFVPNRAWRYLKNGVYLPHAVDCSIFKPCRQKLFDEFTFLWVGRDERRKALGRAILAFEKIHKKYDCKFVVRANWGGTPESARTHRYIKVKGIPIIQDKMSNCPHSYLANVYSACDAYICSAKAGASEMGILEANACGLPALVTDWTFMNENVKDGTTGFLIPVESYDIRPKRKQAGIHGNGRIWGNISINALAERMAWMLENQKKVEKLSVKSFDYTRKNYSWKAVAEKFFDVIVEDLNKEKGLY